MNDLNAYLCAPSGRRARTKTRAATRAGPGGSFSKRVILETDARRIECDYERIEDERSSAYREG